MSMTIEFYSADPQELVTLFSKYFSDPPDDLTFFDKLETYPKAKFPGRLLLPDDLDSLCQILRKHHQRVPSTFRDLLIEQVWSDSQVAPSESLTLLSDQLANELAKLSESVTEQVALDWAATFPLREPLQQSLPYQAIQQLWEIARDAVARKKSLIFHLDGSPGFFEYLRYL